jgi:hypothetical protein
MIMDVISKNFSYKNSVFFKMSKSEKSGKVNTGRVVGYKELGIILSYTIESSFFCSNKLSE